MKEQDKQNIEKYIVILHDFIENEISAKEFSRLFLQIRRKDAYLFAGHYDDKIEKVLSTLMLDVDHYCEPELADYDKNNPNHDITAEELCIYAKEALGKLEIL